jgi:PKD repeat protein
VSSTAIATWPVVAQPALPTLASTIPSSGTAICIGDNGPSATITPGSGGAGSTDTYTYSINNGSTTAAYTSGTDVNTAGGTADAVIYASRSASTALGCNATATVAIATWPLVTAAVVTTQPGSQSVCTGGNITLTAVASGAGSYLYQWYYNNTTNSNSGGTAIATGTGVVAAGATASYALATTNASTASPGGTGVPGSFYYYCIFTPLNNTGCGPVTTNAAEVTVNPILTPSVSIASNVGATICTGTNVTFTATPTNGGLSPTYNWKLNGNVVGGGSTFTTSTLANGDVISCALTSSIPCPTPSATASSNTITMTVNPYVPVSVTIDPHPFYLICSNTTLTFNATPVNGGTSPSYQWQVNSGSGYVNVGTNSPTYSSSTPVNNDLVRCIMTSNEECPSPAVATSNVATMVVGTCNNTWTGAVSTSWDNAGNWSAGVVPGNCADGANFPPNLSNYPVLTQNEYVGNVIMQGNATINLQSNNLYVCQNWISPTAGSTAVSGTGMLSFDGITNATQTITGNVNLYELNIDNSGGGNVALASGANVNVTNAVDLQESNLDVSAGKITFLSTSPAQVAILDNFSSGYSGTITGNITAERYYAAADYVYTDQHELGLPVSGVSLSKLGAGSTSGYVVPETGCNEYQVANGSPYGQVFSYHENAPGASACGMAQWYVEPGTDVANAGQGYSVALISNGTISVNGPSNLNSSYTISGNNSNWSNTTYQGHLLTSGWQLVSNPYLATLVIKTNNPGMDNQVQVWQANGQYKGTYQPGMVGSAVIAPFQAFMVHVSAPGSASYTINGTDRSRTTPSTFYAQNANELDITAENLTNNLLDKTVVAFNSNATDTFDTQYDANKLVSSGNRHTLYTTLANGRWMAINTQNSVATTGTVPMGFEPGATASFNLSFSGVNSFDPTTYIFLEDKQQKLMYNVRNGDYQFSSDSADNRSRFVLHFTPPAVINQTDATCNSLGTITVTQPGTANWNYTLTGNNNATIASGILNENNSINLSAPAGTYTLTLTDNNNYTVTKVIQINGLQPVTAAFTPSVTTVNAQTPVSFANTSQNANTFSWSFGDGGISSLVSPVHTYVTPGVYDVVLTATNTGGCSSTMDEEITVNALLTSISKTTENGISLWSNRNMVYVDFSEAGNVNALIKIYNVLGQELSEDRFTSNTLYEKGIDDIDAAYIIVSVANNEKVTTKKLFITNITR